MNTYLQGLLIVLVPILAISSAFHALLYKRDSRAALGWISLCLIFPVAGPVFYYLFGINRVHTRARILSTRSPFRIAVGYERAAADDYAVNILESRLPESFRTLARISDHVTRRSVLEGNAIQILHNGEQTYPAMLADIESAKHTVCITTYILDTGITGRRFIDALSRAAKRGVEVRVMIDGIGELYSFPRASRLLHKRGIRVVRFLPPRLIPPSLHINLRNHRKILVIDGDIAFTGGMNIGDRHLACNTANPARVIDMHFRIRGPVVAQIETAFIEDWRFCTGEMLDLLRHSISPQGSSVCRTVTDGPNEDLDKLAIILMAAVSVAQRNVLVMTPYFIPSRELISAMQSAALRGVDITIILPAKNNLLFVHWASRNLLWELLQWNVKIYYQPAPFVHSKLFIVDGSYAHIGSANLDPRSLRLNFELVIEVFDADFVSELVNHFNHVREHSDQVTLQEIDNRSLAARTRDALCWLFSPYL